jgi:hypothetical protein
MGWDETLRCSVYTTARAHADRVGGAQVWAISIEGGQQTVQSIIMGWDETVRCSVYTTDRARARVGRVGGAQVTAISVENPVGTNHPLWLRVTVHSNLNLEHY